MATKLEFVEFVCDQITDCGIVSHKKMFGEYMVYVNAKPILLLCDNIVYVKQLPAICGLLQDADKGFPYNGAKEHFILDIEDRELSTQVVNILESIIPIPVPKKKKVK